MRQLSVALATVALLSGCKAPPPPPPPPPDVAVLYASLEKVIAALPSEAKEQDCRKKPDQKLLVLGYDTLLYLLGKPAEAMAGSLSPFDALEDFRVSALHPRGQTSHPEEVRQAMENYSRATHLAIFRVTAYSAPGVVGNTFTPGSAQATVSVFAKDTGALTCSAQVVATNGEKTYFLKDQATGYRAETANANGANYSVKKDLRERFAQAVRKSLGTEF